MYPLVYIVLPSYQLLAFLGGFFAICLLYFRKERFQIEFTRFLILLVISFVGCFAGSKILYAITQIPWLISHFSLWNLITLIPNSGLVFYGGLLGTILGLLFYTRKDADFRKRVFRMATPAFPLFHCFGRIGCFMTGCCYGKELDSPINLAGMELDRIPVQLMEAAAELILFALLMVLDRKKEEINLLRVYMVSYAVIRFADEFLRGDQIRGIFLGLSTSQWISLGILIFWCVKSVKEKNKK